MPYEKYQRIRRMPRVRGRSKRYAQFGCRLRVSGQRQGTRRTHDNALPAPNTGSIVYIHIERTADVSVKSAVAYTYCAYTLHLFCLRTKRNACRANVTLTANCKAYPTSTAVTQNDLQAT